MRSLCSVFDILQQTDSLLGKLLIKSRSIDALNKIFSQVLAPELLPHCRVGSYFQGVLVLFTTSSARATQLRYQIPHLLSTLRTYPEWAGLCSIQIKVETKPPIIIEEKPPTPSTPMVIPEASRAHLKSLANDLREKPGMESLVASLDRLARQK